MPRFEFKKYVQLPVSTEPDQVFKTSLFMVGRYVGTSFRKVVTFDDERKAKKFIEDYSGTDSQFVSDFVLYQFDLCVHFPDGYDPAPALFGSYYKYSQNR